MSGDFTRHTFNKNKHYSGVQLQQGRVQIDADFNEQVNITHHTERVTMTDVIGITGMPEDAPGFSIEAIDGDLILGPGRAYVDGILVEYDAALTTLEKSDGAGANTVWLAVEGPRLLVKQWLVKEGTSIKDAFFVSELLDDAEDGKQRLKISKVQGSDLITVSGLASVITQPDMPAADLPDVVGSYLVYLDVWERDITALEDPGIKEVALGGIDTATRTKVVWQVKILGLKPPVDEHLESKAPVCAEFAAGWSPISDIDHVRLSAWTDPSDITSGPCVLPSKGCYRDLENHLYRVQIHGGGVIGQDKVFIKWSRDNAIYRSKLLKIKDGNLLVDSIGKDDVTSFKPGEWLEVQDEARIQTGEAGFFVHIGGVVENSLKIIEILNPGTLDPLTDGNGDPDINVLPDTGVVCRWEGGKPVEVNHDTQIALENGVQVQLTEGLSANNDYWLIPARALTADVEWPTNPADGSPAFERPCGIRHHFAALALATLGNATHHDWKLTDCRNIFPPLTRLPALFYVSGDGQEATPDLTKPDTLVSLGMPLKVGVARGSTPIKGARVLFRVTKGDGRLKGEAGDVKELPLETDEKGVISAEWFLEGKTEDQQVTAELIDSADSRRHIPIIFTGHLSLATEVAYDPSGCEGLLGKTTVQLAIDALCTMKRGGCATYVVVPADWAKVLRSLKKDENAHICFQRGRYEEIGTVEMKDLGHVTLSGVGEGTEVFSSRTEMIFHFVNCKSVTVESMKISAMDGNRLIGHVKSLNGVLTATSCGSIMVRDTVIRCGAGTSLERTCVTVRSNNLASVTPTNSVRILSNRLEVGHSQNGILVTDANRVLIEDNEISVRKRPRSLIFEHLILDKKVKAKLVRALVSDSITGENEPVYKKRKVLKAGGYAAVFESSVPDSEFRTLMKNNPPSSDDIISAEKFGDYVDKLVDLAVEKPELLPSYNSKLNRVRSGMNGDDFNRLNRFVRKELVVSGNIEIMKFTDLLDEKRDVAIVVDNNRLQFNSPIIKREWVRIIDSHKPERIRSDADLLTAVKSSASRLITDSLFRNKFSAAKNLFEKLKLNNPAVGEQAIVCGGSKLIDVRIRKNSIVGFNKAIHVGVSKKEIQKGTPLLVNSVDISENRVLLRIPLRFIGGGRGIFIGNAYRILVENNEIINVKPEWDAPGLEGIYIWGHLGPFIVLRQNSIKSCWFGINVYVESSLPNGSDSPLWRAVDNYISDGNINIATDYFLERDNVIT